MGGDAAPGPELEGAVAAVRERLARVILVGDEARLRAGLAELGATGSAGSDGPDLRVHHASEVITMDDPPAVAAKTKKDSSMRVAFDLTKRGEADAVVSAGNSGAMLACGLFVMKRLEGVDRPGIVTTFPTKNGVCALMDMGANIECRPLTLAQFAVLGSVYVRLYHGKTRPKVGLLSNGTEPGKGTELTRETDKLLSRLGTLGDHELEYVGYVEGRDIFSGDVDVVVTDGFTGNVVLKASEGVAQLIVELLKNEVMRSGALGKVGALLLRGAFRDLKTKLDYAEHGGAPLVGVGGVPILCHGGSSARAIKNGIRVAAEFARSDMSGEVARAIARHAALWEDGPAHATGL
jgi:glycerol-3-phosphate acyltransferase PlsX